MVYGGTIRPGACEGQPQLDIVSAFQSYGKYLQDGKTEDAEAFRANTIRHACPGPGACGGVSVFSLLIRSRPLYVSLVEAQGYSTTSLIQMYTANTMASAAEALGMTLPGSSSFPAEEKDKLDECESVGAAMRNLLEMDLKPRDIMTREAFENAMVSCEPSVERSK